MTSYLGRLLLVAVLRVTLLCVGVLRVDLLLPDLLATVLLRSVDGIAMQSLEDQWRER